MAETYIVVAPLALVRRTNGTAQYCYQGTPVPQDAMPGEVERLAGEGFIATDAVFAVPIGGNIPVVVDGEGNPVDFAAAAAADPGLLNVQPVVPVVTEPVVEPVTEPVVEPAAEPGAESGKADEKPARTSRR